MFSDHTYLYALTKIPQLGPKRLQALLQAYEQNPQAIWEDLSTRNQGIFTKHFHTYLRNALKTTSLTEREAELETSQSKQVAIIDEDYPSYLQQIPDPPTLLFYKGVLPTNQQLITIVGTRKMTRYGHDVLEDLISACKQKQIGIISGLAFGIDAKAHRMALQEQLYTMAILGSSVNYITPSNHLLLAQEMIEMNGCILSESPPFAKAYDGSFPKRNRLLAGISPITLVIEAAEKSGALITARFALDYNREVCAIPGSIFSRQQDGCHQLLREGAQLITSPHDLFALLEEKELYAQSPQKLHLSQKEQALYDILSHEPKPIDLLATKFEGRSSELFALLTSLELKSLIRNKPGEGYYKRSH